MAWGCWRGCASIGDIAVPAIVQTAHGSIEVVISAMRAGATDFVVKPIDERLQVSIKNALRVDALEDECSGISPH